MTSISTVASTTTVIVFASTVIGTVSPDQRPVVIHLSLHHLTNLPAEQ